MACWSRRTRRSNSTGLSPGCSDMLHHVRRARNQSFQIRSLPKSKSGTQGLFVLLALGCRPLPHCSAERASFTGSSLANGRGLLGLRRFSGRRALGFGGCRLTVARGGQFLLELQALVGCHGGLFALRRQIFHREISACFRRRRRLSPRVHQRSGGRTAPEREAQQKQRSPSQRGSLLMDVRSTHA